MLNLLPLVGLLALSPFAQTLHTPSKAADSAAEESKTIADKTAGMRKLSGLLDAYLDDRDGKVWLRLVPEGSNLGEFLYVEGLVTGLGSNPVGLDRGQLGRARCVRMRRVGGKVMVEEPNLGFRADTDDAAEALATRQSFAPSILWAGPIAARDDDGSVLVDFTSFLVRDAHGIARTLKRTGEGAFKLDRDRSAVELDASLAFPDNLVFEALLTFAGDDPGTELRSTLADPHSVGLTLRHTLVRLPDGDFAPREWDPRTGSFAVSFSDYAVPLDAPIERAFAVRHRLKRSADGTVADPIVYYVDRGAPEPVRSALVEGASWWADAFEAAGFPGGFRVELMPEGAHPLDVRYNVIQWVHRSTRGWSYGGGVTDPRTGEMIKGHVSLGSLRVRQDRRIFEGLGGVEATGSGATNDPIELALARIRQLSAHEVGHTLGLAHNFAASTYGRASVMDYPAPWVRATESDELDFSSCYAVGIGTWDKHAIRWLYSQFEAGADEAAGLDRIAREGIENKWIYLSDGDARAPWSSHPLGNLWDNGADPVAELENVLRVRDIALDKFGLGNLHAGRPLAELQEVLAPVYFYHRYQVEAAIKVIGGWEYAHSMKGDGQGMARFIGADRQREALDVVLSALAPERLAISPEIQALLLPRPPEVGRNREMFAQRTTPSFDALGAARSAADLVLAGLLNRERCARLVQASAWNSTQLGLSETLQRIADVVAPPDGGPTAPELRAVQRAVQSAYIARLIELAGDERATPEVRALVETHARAVPGSLMAGLSRDPDERGYAGVLAGQIHRFLQRTGKSADTPRQVPAAPPGSPIGSAPSLYSRCSLPAH